MRWGFVIIALVLTASFGLAAVPGAQAQERDGCHDTRFGRMGCLTDIDNFNWDDPGPREWSRHRQRGTIVVMSNVEMIEVVVPDNMFQRPRDTWRPGEHLRIR